MICLALIMPFRVAAPAVEQNAHHVPDFAAGTRCPFQMFEPQFHLHSLDVRQKVVSLARHNPFAEIALIGSLSRVREAGVRTAQFTLV